jgi:ribonuclease HI
MLHVQLFTDGSVNTQFKVGYGAYLVVSAPNTCAETLKDSVKIKRFTHTSSTKLELQTLMWALRDIMILADTNDITLTIYSDSQNIIALPQRRERLEQNNYYSSKGKQLHNTELYQEFYQLSALLKFKLVKVVGHQPTSQKDDIARLFTLVDRASRQALRAEFNLPSLRLIKRMIRDHKAKSLC